MTEEVEDKAFGRPPFEITPEVIERAYTYAFNGLAKYQIAASLGISYETLNEKCKAFPDFSDAIDDGKAKGTAEVVGVLKEKAIEGDIPAIKYYLNNKTTEWSDRTTTVHEGEMTLVKLGEEELQIRFAQAKAKMDG